MLKKFLAILLMLYAAACFAAVDVNKATAAELESVKGIGPIISGKIVEERKKGNFKDWDDFVNRVKGVGDKSAAKLSEAGLTVGGASFSGLAPAAAPAAKKEDKPAAAPPTAPAAKAEAKPAIVAASAAPKSDAKLAAPAKAAAPAASAAKADPKAEAKVKADEAKAKEETEKKAKADDKQKADESKAKKEAAKKVKGDAKTDKKDDKAAATKTAASAAKK